MDSYVGKRRLEDMHMNELRMILYDAGVEYAPGASKADLIELIKSQVN